jgi:arylsulfatase A-like enzyme/Flp pilus assembly protein TadD
LASFACQPARVERVVLVSIDTLRADYVGVYGASNKTPNLDAIAAGGVRFATAISPTPITLPSHASILTGLDPPRHGIRNNSTFRLPEDVSTLAEKMHEANFATAAFIGAMVLDRQYGLARGFDIYDDRMSPRLSAGADGFPERTADAVVDAALAWLENAPDQFLLWVHLYDPHSSYRAPARFRRENPRSPYAAEVGFADHELGRLLEAVDNLWGANTLVVVTSDHGESLGEHGEVTHSLGIYDATQRVPLLMRGPGLPQGTVVESPVRLVDIAPTILALINISPLTDVDGRDLTGAINGDAEQAPVAYLETLATQLEIGWSPLLGIRSAEFKYIRAPRPELYALASDPEERHDIIAEQPDVAARLDRELDRILPRGRPVQPTHTPDAESQELLESLGYLNVTPTGGGRFGLGLVRGIDPKDGLAQVTAINEAWIEARKSGSAEALERLAAIEGGGFFRAQLGAQAAFEAGNAAAAESFARAALREAPEFWESHNTLGRALLMASKLDAAEAAFSTAATLNGATADPWVGLGRIAEARDAPEKAASLYEHAIERRGNSGEAPWRLAALRFEAGDEQNARQILATIDAEALEHPEAALRLSRAVASRGHTDSARERLDAALKRYPDHARLLAARRSLDSH